MSLDLLEKKYKYLEEKEKVIRDLYDTKVNRLQTLAAPSRARIELSEIQRKLLPKGYNPDKPCILRDSNKNIDFTGAVLVEEIKEYPTKLEKPMIKHVSKLLKIPENQYNRQVISQKSQYIEKMKEYLQNTDKKEKTHMSNFEILRSTKSRCIFSISF